MNEGADNTNPVWIPKVVSSSSTNKTAGPTTRKSGRVEARYSLFQAAKETRSRKSAVGAYYFFGGKPRKLASRSAKNPPDEVEVGNPLGQMTGYDSTDRKKANVMDNDYTDAKIEASEARSRENAALIRSEFKEETASLRQDMTVMRGEMREEFAAIRGEMREGFAAINTRLDHIPSTTKTIGIAFGSAVAIIGIVFALVQTSYDRFDAGLAATPAFEREISAMESRLSEAIDRAVKSASSQPPPDPNTP